MDNNSVPEKRDNVVSSRREVVRAIPVVALGSAALNNAARAETTTSKIPSIRIPTDFLKSLSAPPGTVSNQSNQGSGPNGAQIFAGMCKDENLAAMFCAAGNYSVINAIAETGIPCYGGRTEGSMVFAADGFSRVTGEVVACSGTEGPGFTHMIQAIYTAAVAHTPLLVLASNTSLAQDDSQSDIQSMGDGQQALTTGIKKYGKRLTALNRIKEYGGYAFRMLNSGVPGPVHLDFPGEVANAPIRSHRPLTMDWDKSKYRSESRPAPTSRDIALAVEMISKAERPLIIAGQGVFQRRAWDKLMSLVNLHECGVCGSGPGRGQFPDDHPLSLSLSPNATMSADLIIFIGQYLMPTRMDWRSHPDARTIRVHPVQEDLGRNWPLDLGIVSDEGEFLDALINHLPKKKRPEWVTEIAAGRAAYQKQMMDGYYALGLKYSSATNRLHPAVIGRELYNFFYNGKLDPKQTINVWGGLTNLRFVPQYMRCNRAGQGICSYYQSGTIGAEISHAIGAAVAAKTGYGIQSAYKGAPTLVVTSDSSLAYSLMDLDTAAKYRLPLIVVIYNNNCWGTWTMTDDSPRALQMYLYQENLRYDKAAEALGCHGEYVQTPEELRAAIARSYEVAAKQNIPALINCQAIKEFTSGTLYPPGANIGTGPGIDAISH